jgi:competence protein ComEC
MFRHCLHAWAALGLLVSVHAANGQEITWTMLNVTPKEGQADCHLLEMPDGSKALIDPADAWDAPGTAVAELTRRNVRELSLVVISHFHRDHYGRLIDILNAGIKVGLVVLNVPDKASADREIPWGCDWNHVQSVLAELRAKNVPFYTPEAGKRILETTTTDGILAGIDIICLFDGKTTPVGPTDVNDTSIILRVFVGTTSALFTGDLNHNLGAYLAESGYELRANILKAPHHGAESAAPDAFYDRVGASVLMVSSPKALWESARSMRTRNYFLERNIPVYVTGINGSVKVRLRSDGYTVEKER